MKESLVNPPIEKVQQGLQAVEGAFHDFDAKIKKLVLVHDFTYEKSGFASKALFFTLPIFLIGIFVFMGWFYAVDIETRASVAIWGVIGLFLVLGVLIISVWGIIRTLKNFSAYLLRREVQNFTKKSARQVTNIKKILEPCPIVIDGKKPTNNNEILKKLDGISKGFEDINDSFSYYPSVPPVSMLSIGSLLVAILGIPSTTQWIATICGSELTTSYLSLFSVGFIIVILVFVILYFFCSLRKENISNIFGVKESKQRLEDALEQINILLIGEDLKKRFSDGLLIYNNKKN